MVPAESYLDVTTGLYDQYLTHNDPEWETLQPEFHYHGRNIYGYLLSSSGLTSLNKTINWTSSSEVQTISIPPLVLFPFNCPRAVYNVSIWAPPPLIISSNIFLHSIADGMSPYSSSPTHLTIPPTQLVS
jgi:hypothetical protein